jgi:nitroreductase
MQVTDALESRFTCRAYLPTPVPRALVEDLLTQASRAPSGGNLQPWRVWALAGEDLRSLEAAIASQIAAGRYADGDVEYYIYPPEMKEPYASRRFRIGEAMYAALGVTREDAAGRMGEYERNFQFFGAPVGLFFAIDRSMQQGQWADLGMYMQSLMLLARERGLHTAALESWSLWHRTVRAALQIPDELMLFCAMALGHADFDAPVNMLRAERAPLSAFACLRGFAD